MNYKITKSLEGKQVEVANTKSGKVYLGFLRTDGKVDIIGKGYAKTVAA